MGESRKGERLGGEGVAPTPVAAAARAKEWAGAAAVATSGQAPPVRPTPPAPPREGLPAAAVATLAAPAARADRPPSFTTEVPTPPRPPIPHPPEPPRPPAPPVATAAGVTATVTPLAPKGLRARLRKARPRNLAIAGAVAAAVVAAAAVLGVFLLGAGGTDDKPAEYAFDSDAVHRVTDGLRPSVSPGDASSQGDPNSLWNYGVTPYSPATPGSGTSKYAPPYRSGSSGRFIPYTPPYGTSGGSGSGGSGGDGGGGAATAEPRPMQAGAYGYGGAGTIPAGLWSAAGAVPATVAAAVTTSDGGCAALSLAAGKNTVQSTYCAAGGVLTAGPRTRAMPTGTFTMTCPGAFVPAGNTALACTATSGKLSEELTGGVSVADTGTAWVATTSVTGPTGDSWTEQVTIDKASGNVVSLRSDISIAVFAYQESSAFTLR